MKIIDIQTDDFQKAILELMEEKLPINLSLMISNLFNHINLIIDNYEEKRKELLNNLIEKDDQGINKTDGDNFVISEENRIKFESEINILLFSDVIIPTIPISLFPVDFTIKPNRLNVLKFIR